MEYALLIYAAEERFGSLSEAEKTTMFADYGGFTRKLKASGKGGDSAPLAPVSTATTVRVRDGKRLLTDGPFAETREQLAGYYVVSTETLDEALEWAAQIPDARG